MPSFDRRIDLSDASDGYIIVENLKLDGTQTGCGNFMAASHAHHVAMRSCVITGTAGSAVMVYNHLSDGSMVHDVVVYNNLIYNNGDWLADYDQDYHGVGVENNTSDIWVLDNEMFHNSGNGLQILNRGFDNAGTRNIYVGRNTAHHNKQSGLWTKTATNVIFSQNVSYGGRPVGAAPSCPGDGIGIQYGPENVWVLFNEIYDCDNGIRLSADDGGTGQNLYVIGNVIHDIHHSTVDVTGQFPVAYDPNDPWSPGKAIAIWHSKAVKHIVGNTIYDADGGIYHVRQGPATIIANNIISGIDDGVSVTRHVFIEDPAVASASDLYNNLFDVQPRISWGGPLYNTLAAFQAAFPGKGLGCVVGDPCYVDAPNGDFHLRPESAAIDRGAPVLQDYLNLFETLFGISITGDFGGSPWFVGAGVDVGAYEFSGGPVNHMPIAVGDAATTGEDTQVVTPNVLANDTDPDGDILTVSAFTQAAHGSVASNGDGTFTYQPNTNYNGSDYFTYTVSDGQGGRAVGTVYITVTPVNDRPVATAQSVTVAEDGSVTITLSGTDVETAAGSLVAAIGTQPTHGTLTLVSGNQYRYTPAANYNGADSFAFTVTDTGDPAGVGTSPALTSNPATVGITVAPVNNKPTATAQSVSVNEDGSVNITLSGTDVETAAASLVAAIGTQPTHGTLTLLGGNQYRYIPAAHYNGTDSLTFTVRDDGSPAGSHANPGDLTSDPATVTITVSAVNDKPVAQPQSQYSGIDTPLVITLVATDVETPFADLTFNVPARTAHGTLTATGHGLYQYVPDAGYKGADSFTFTVTDTGDPAGTAGNALTSDPATVSVSVYRKVHFTGKTKAQYVDANGNKVTVSLSGPGSGDLYFVTDGELGSAQGVPDAGGLPIVGADPPADARALVLNGTTTASRVTISTAPSKRTTVQDIIINGALASLSGATTDLTGNVTATGVLPQLTLGDVKGPSEIHLNMCGAALARPPRLSMSFRDVADCSIDTNGLTIGSLRAARWLNNDGIGDTIRAPGLNMLMILGRTIYAKTGTTRIAGDFEAGLRLAGIRAAWQPALSLALINGKLADAAWDVGGNVGTLLAGSVGDSFTGSFTGRIGSVSTGGNLSGGWTARSIGTLRVGDSLVGAAFTLTEAAAPKSMAAALGYMSVRRWIDASDIESAGTIGNVTAGAIRDSDVFAGVVQTRDSDGDGRADLPDPGTDFDVLALAAIKTVTINGIRGEEFAVARSNIAAANLGQIAIGKVNADNAGKVYGLAGRRLGSLRCASPLTTPASSDGTPSLGDFKVLVSR
jgi:VCBS repeat-containing protein